MKRHLGTALIFIMIIAGIGTLLYPTISNYFNEINQTRVLDLYDETVDELSEEARERMIQDAKDYNNELLGNREKFKVDPEALDYYHQTYNILDDGTMGYIEIDKIGLRCSIKHGTTEETLKTAIGHLAGTSFPVEGQTVHSVLSGHRGLPTYELFTKLDRMEIGDTFKIRSLDGILYYEIDQITTVDPNETAHLDIVDGRNYVTLVTCTPYSVNTHRLLVRGELTEAPNVDDHVRTGQLSVDPVLSGVVAAVALGALMLAIRKARKRGARPSP